MDQRRIIRETKLLGQRIKALRESANHTRKQMAATLGLSEGTLISIERGEDSIDFKYIVAIAEYFGMKTPDLVNTEKDLLSAREIRSGMLRYHTEKESFSKDLLNQTPKLTWCLKRLCEEGYFNMPRKVKDISEKIHDQFEVKFDSSKISNALIKLFNEGHLIRSKSGEKNYLYQIA